MDTDSLDDAAVRSEQRRRQAEQRAELAERRAATARRHAEKARTAGNLRAAAIHEHEAVVHQRAIEIHQRAARLQRLHREELDTAFGHSGGIDPSGLRLIADNVRRARDEAEVRSQQARTYATRARARAEQLQTDRRACAADA